MTRQELNCRIALLKDKIREDEQELREDKKLLLNLQSQLDKSGGENEML